MIVLKTIRLQRGFEIVHVTICGKLKGDLDLMFWILRRYKAMKSLTQPALLQQQQESAAAATKLGF